MKIVFTYEVCSVGLEWGSAITFCEFENEPSVGGSMFFCQSFLP
jgi:hypothetical protein